MSPVTHPKEKLDQLEIPPRQKKTKNIGKFVQQEKTHMNSIWAIYYKSLT